jgi:hypothetical protein
MSLPYGKKIYEGKQYVQWVEQGEIVKGLEADCPSLNREASDKLFTSFCLSFFIFGKGIIIEPTS